MVRALVSRGVLRATCQGRAPREARVEATTSGDASEGGAQHRRRTVSGVIRFSWGRSEERRVGKECTVLCRSRWSPYH